MRARPFLSLSTFMLIGAVAGPATAQGDSAAGAGDASSRPASRPAAAASEGRLHILFTSDIYGRFAWPGCGARVPGKADLTHLAAAVKKKRAEIRGAGDGAPMVVAGGSMIRPDVMGNHLFRGGKAHAPAAVELLGAVGFDAVAVGRFDFGSRVEAMKLYMRLMKKQGIPLLASNVTCEDKSDFRCAGLGKGGRPYVVLQQGDLRVGVLAINREDMPRRILKKSRGTMKAEDPAAASRRLLRLLREKENVHVTVMLANLNLENDAPMPVVSFVRSLGKDAPDLVVTDSMYHRGSEDFISRIQSLTGSTIVGTDRFGQHLGHATIKVVRAAGKIKVSSVDVKVEPVASATPDPAHAHHVKAIMGELCRAVNQPLGQAHFKEPMKRATFMTYMMEVMRNHVGAELTILNDSCVADTSFPMRGALTREMILRAIRTETRMGSVWISGKRLEFLLKPYILGKKHHLHFIGLEKRGIKWYVNNRPLQSGLHYRVATTRFVADGGDGHITLKTEEFKDSGRSLRDLIVDFFGKNRQARLDGDAGVDLKSDFSDPWEKWVLYGGVEAGFSVSSLSIGNGDDGKRYNRPLLKRDNMTALKLELDLGFGASNKDHAIEGDISLQYGQTWTLTAADEAAGKDSTQAESLDRIRGDVLYRLNMLRNKDGPGEWYLPVPYAELTLLSEFTESGCTPYGAECDESSSDFKTNPGETYRYLDIGATVGVGFLLLPKMFAKVGFATGDEVLTPKEALENPDDQKARTGIYIGYKLRRMKLISSVKHPLQLESRLDFFFTDLGGTLRRELTLETKLYFSLVPMIYLTAGHSLYYFEDRKHDAGIANDISFGIEFLMDYRHQLF